MVSKKIKDLHDRIKKIGKEGNEIDLWNTLTSFSREEKDELAKYQNSLLPYCDKKCGRKAAYVVKNLLHEESKTLCGQCFLVFCYSYTLGAEKLERERGVSLAEQMGLTLGR